MNRRVDFPEEDPYIMDVVLRYLYTGEYTVPNASSFKFSNGSKLLAPRPMQRSVARLGSSCARKEYLWIEDAKPLDLHVLVYKCADMLGIENLKVFAATRFLKESETALKEESFARQLETVYESTSPNDQPLRLAVTSLCLKNHDQLPAEVTKVVQMNEPNVWLVALPFLKESACLVEQAKKAVLNKINLEFKKECHGLPPKKFSVTDSGEIYRHCGSGRQACKKQL